MSSNVDLSQFGFIPKQAPEENQQKQVDLAQFGFIPKKTPKVQPETSFWRTAANFAVGGASGVGGVGGDILSLINSAADYAAREAVGFIKGKSGEQVKRDTEKVLETNQLGKELTQLLSNPLPTSEQIGRGFDFVTGGLTAPQTAVERGARTAGQFVGAGAISPAGLRVPGARELSGLLGAGIGTSIAEENDAGILGSILGGTLGFAAGRGAAGIGSLAKTAATKGSKGVAARLLGGKLDKEFVRQAKQLGIEITPGSALESRAAEFIESKLAQSGLTGEALQARRKEIGESLARAFKQDAEQLSTQSFENTREGLVSLSEGVKESKNLAMQPIEQMYEAARFAVPESETIAPQKLAKKLQDLKKELGETLLKGEATDANKVRKVISNLENQVIGEGFSGLLDAQGNPIQGTSGRVQNVRVRDLVGTVRELNDIINYEVQGGTKQLLKGVNAEIRKELEAYGKRNPGFLKNYKEAQKSFGELAETFRKSKDINRLILSDAPGTLTGVGNSVDSLRQIERALKPLPNGKELFNKFKRTKLEEVLVNQVVDPVTGNVSLTKGSNILKNPQKRAIIKELVGKEGFQRLEKLSSVSRKLDTKLGKFLNNSQTATNLIDAGLSFSIMKDLVMGVATLNPLLITKGGAKYFAPRLMGNLWADKAFLNEVIALAEKPVNRSFAKDFARVSARIAKEVETLQKDAEN